jgi:hypothetical protein
LDLYRGLKLLGGMCCSVDPVTKHSRSLVSRITMSCRFRGKLGNVTVNRLFCGLFLVLFLNLTPFEEMDTFLKVFRYSKIH